MPEIEPVTHGDRPRFILALMALILPPLPLFLMTAPHYTLFTKEIFISVLLTLLGHVPGIIFSLYLIFTKDDIHDGFARGDGAATSLLHDDVATHNHVDHPPTVPYQPYTDNAGGSSQPHDDPPQYAESTHPSLADTKGTDHKVQH